MTAAGQSQIYRDLMRFKPEGLSPNAWAVQAGVSRTVWADMRRHGNPSRRTLERLLTVAGSTLAEFEALRLGPDARAVAGGKAGLAEPGRTWLPSPLPPLPLVASAAAGASGEFGDLMDLHRGDVVEQLTRPLSLAADIDAFALTIIGNAMWPRFSAGQRVAVSPGASIAPGDEILLRLKRATGDRRELVVIRHLIERTERTIRVRQFNPDERVSVDAADVDAMCKVVGELI